MKARKSSVGRLLFLAALLAVALAVFSQTACGMRLARFPYVQLATTSSITIIWKTTAPALCAVEYGLTPEMASEKEAPGPGKHHVIELVGLKANSVYHYRVLADGVPLMDPATFKTAKDEPNFSFAVLGDSGKGKKMQKKVAAQMRAVEPDFVLHTGDVVYRHGAAEDYEAKFFLPYRDMLSSICFYPTLGNHDYVTEGGQPYLDAFVLPANNPARSERYYSFDYANAHFVCIDSMLPYVDIPAEEEQFAWLKEDLASTRKPWKFVFMHYPPYSAGRHGSDMKIRDRYSPLFEEFSVNMVFTGHDHNYQRTVPLARSSPAEDGVTYIVTGGGGHPNLYDMDDVDWTVVTRKIHHFVLIEIAENTLRLKAIDSKGEVFDELALQLDADGSDTP